MRYAFDIIHPAHVHLFANAMRTIRDRGDEIFIASRRKELVCELLDGLGFEHRPLSTKATGVIGLGLEMLVHQGRLGLQFLDRKPDMVAAHGGPLSIHVSRLFCPAVVFTDTHIAFMQNRITFPFASYIVVPECYPGPYYGAEGRVVRYRGYHELAYLHPNRFTPNPGIRAALGVGEREKFFIVRFVAWTSSHDFRASGLSLDQKRSLIALLQAEGKVFITSETELPEDLQPLRYPLDPGTIHHAVAEAEMVVGESATMASEAAVLGVRSIFISPIPRCYTDDQEQRYGLVRTIAPERFDEIGAQISRWLSDPAGDAVAAARERLLHECVDVTDMIVSVLTDVAAGQRPAARWQSTD